MEFLFQSRVVFTPEAREVLRDLDRARVRREHMHKDWNAAHGDFGCGVDVVEFLDAQCDVRRIAELVGNFWRLAVGEAETFRSVFVEEVLLSRAEPGFNNRLHRFVFDVFIAKCTVTDLFDEMTAVFISDWRESEFRAPLAKQIQTKNPLFGGVVPVVQRKLAGEDFVGEQFRGGIGRRRIDPASADDKVPEAKLFLGVNALGRRIVKYARHGGDVVGKEFLQPFLFDDGREAEDGVDSFVFAFNFTDFGCDEEVGVVDDAFTGENTATAMDEVAAECA